MEITMTLKEMLKWIKSPTREDLINKVNKSNDTVLFTEGLGPDEVNFVARKKDAVKYGSISLSKGKWSIQRLDNE
tara:strand:+ start:2817 stop:3041 length:225 start_codon:yes stop_codon:yes gene_type:complete